MSYQHTSPTLYFVHSPYYIPHSANAKAPARRAPPPPAGAQPLRPLAAPAPAARAPPRPATKPTKRPAPLPAAKAPVVPPKPAPRQRPPPRGVNDVISTAAQLQGNDVSPTLRDMQDKAYNSIVCAEAPSADYAAPVAVSQDVVYGDQRDSLTEEGGCRPLPLYSGADHRKSTEYEYPEVRRGKVSLVYVEGGEHENMTLRVSDGTMARVKRHHSYTTVTTE